MKRLTLLLAAMAVVATAFAVITEQPAGTLKNYTREGKCVLADYEAGLYVAYQEGKVSIVYAEDGKIYMKNPIMGMSYDTWVEGSINSDGTLIKIPMGQVLYHSDYYDADVILSWGSTSEGMINWDTYEIEVNYTPDETVSDAVFRIDGDKIYLENTAGAEVLTAEDLAEFAATGLSAIWADTRGWVQTIEWGTVLTELPAAQPAVPANPEIIEWRDLGNESGYNRLEFKIDLVDVDGNPLDVEQGQLTYSVFTDDDQLFTFDSYHYGYDFNYQDVTEVPYNQYSYNFSPNSIFFYRTNAEGYDRFFDWRIGMQVYYTVDGVRNASDIVYLEVFPKPDDPVVPTTPTAAPTFNGYTEDGIHAYFVEIKETEPSTIYYRVQSPDGEWTDWAEYTEVLAFTGNGKYRVEAYAVATDKAPSTEIAYEFVVSPFTGIDEMNADKQVANVRYFNMAGQEMQQANGMTIVVTTYTDGTTSAVKVMK